MSKSPWGSIQPDRSDRAVRAPCTIRTDDDLMSPVSEMSGWLRHSWRMDHIGHRTSLFLLVALLVTGGPFLAMADDDEHDHELARQALSEGRIRPLTEIIDAFKAKFPGDIVGVELETKKGKSFVYEFKVVTPDGKLKEVKVDAQTANIIKIEDDD